MADHRRARGSLVDPVALGWEVEREKRDRFKVLAERYEVSAAVFFELVADHIETELNDQGLPSWLPPKKRDGELPINTA